MDEKLNYVISQLEARKKQFDLIARETNMSRRTLERTMHGSTIPNLRTLLKLYDFLAKNARKKVL